MQQFRACAATHPGTVRTHNEDMFVERPDLGLWAVADGAGGHEAGEVASGMIVSALRAIPGSLGIDETLAEVRSRIAATHTALRWLAADKGAGTIIASTVVAIVIGGGRFACLWAGDSRAYRLGDETLRQVTRDHSLVQELVDAGRIDARDAGHHPRANVITRAVGATSETVELDEVSDRIGTTERFLLCTDGLSKVLDDRMLAQILLENPPEAATTRLIEAALAEGARDNVTAIVIDVTEAV